uniref:Ground-like domain-containing protein n=1 Tax=Meloidogyne floridensis TaxID=298350 RepID=A0A915P280_9BILA
MYFQLVRISTVFLFNMLILGYNGQQPAAWPATSYSPYFQALFAEASAPVPALPSGLGAQAPAIPVGFPLGPGTPAMAPPAPQSSSRRIIRQAPFDSDEDATGGASPDNGNFDGDGAKEEENSPDTMMIYDDDSPVTEESEGKEGKENITKIEKKLAGKLETLNSDKNITFPGINNINIKSEKASIKNEENYKSKIHRKNCNSEVIRRIILENIGARPSVAKRKIQSKATDQIGGRIDVICSRKAFSYVVNSEVFCEVEKADIVCLCYKQQG